MGLLKGSVTISRYKVQGSLPDDLSEFLDQRIKLNIFRDIEESAQESGFGWVSVHDFLDTDFAFASYLLEPYIVLGLRIDKRRVPAGLVRKYHRMEILKALAMRDSRGLSRAEREELKEKVRLTLLKRTPPQTQMLEVVWDLNKAQVWLTSTAKPAMETFESLFKRSFALNLIPCIPAILAQDMLAKNKTLSQAWLDARPLSLPV